MHIEFIDLLRCPKPHEETWLVAALQRMDGRQVVEAKLGCPVCGAEFFIRDGVALFDGDDALDGGTQPLGDEGVTRIAAFLNLTSPGKTVLLAGQLASASESLSERADARVISLNSSSRTKGTWSDRVAELRAAPPLPLAAKSLDGIALDESHSTPELLAEVAKLLRPRGRLLAGARADLSPEFRELARDSDHVVAECVGELVTLRR
ncbi:MAG TPA: hypothetical protein VGJ64_04955 [Gemmatimonadaceae bacterium]|jgi:uncharacterized protein YbaR (Trm112 family)